MHKIKYSILFLLIFLMAGLFCAVQALKPLSLNTYVNPFIGTGGHGIRFPGHACHSGWFN
jgi:hypothetical protein